MSQHHPAIAAYAPARVESEADFLTDFLGVRTRTKFQRAMPYADGLVARNSTALPDFDEEYLEWTDMFESVAEAEDEFMMVELGAGYGRWLVRGATVARQRGLRFRGLAIEADPDHFRWLGEHCRDNGLGEAEVELIWGAVHGEPGFAPFEMGRSDAWYGQAVVRKTTAPYPDLAARKRLRARSILGRPPRGHADAVHAWVPCVTLSDALGAYPRVDLVDMDVQGLELRVVEPAMPLLDARVRRVHIGTHSTDIESGLRALFLGHGWTCVHDYASGSQADTPYGLIRFGDGVQTWVNPGLARDAAAIDGKAPASTPGPPAVTGALPSLLEHVRILEARNHWLEEKVETLRGRLAEMRERYHSLKERSGPGKKSSPG